MPIDFDPSTLNRDLAQAETDAARLEIERATAAKNVARLRRLQRYLRAARWLRARSASFPQFPLVALVVGPLVCGVVTLVALSLVVNSWLVAAGGFLLGATACGIALAGLLFRPADALLPSAIVEVDGKLLVESSRLEDKAAAVAEVQQWLARLNEQRRDLAKGEKLQRAMLLQRNWKAMRGAEWEDYVVEVCRTLGANVQRGSAPVAVSVTETGPGAGKGARGVLRRLPTTLYVTLSPKRFAVAAISDVNPFHAAAVRQVIDHLAQQGCDELGIVTNARLTAGSKEFAKSRHCTLIGEEEFPDFVLGKTSL